MALRQTLESLWDSGSVGSHHDASSSSSSTVIPHAARSYRHHSKNAKHDTSFFLLCDLAYQISGLMGAVRYLLPAPFEHACRTHQVRFMEKREVKELPTKCFDRGFYYDMTNKAWWKCCTENIDLVKIITGPRSGMACMPLKLGKTPYHHEA